MMNDNLRMRRISFVGRVEHWPGVLLGLAATASFVIVSHDITKSRLMMAAIALAALLSSIAGFAFSANCGAMLFHISSDQVHIVQVMIICSIANQAAMTWALRRDIDWRRLWPYLTAGAMGLPIGVALLLHADHVTYTRNLGVFLIVYSAYMLLRKPIIVPGRCLAIDLATAFMGGITGGSAGFPGAFVSIWCAMRGWDKSRQRAVTQPFILLMQLVGLVLIGAWHGPAAGGFDPANLLFVPAGLIGTSMGFALYRRLSDAHFAKGVNLALLASGLSFVV